MKKTEANERKKRKKKGVCRPGLIVVVMCQKREKGQKKSSSNTTRICSYFLRRKSRKKGKKGKWTRKKGFLTPNSDPRLQTPADACAHAHAAAPVAAAVAANAALALAVAVVMHLHVGRAHDAVVRHDLLFAGAGRAVDRRVRLGATLEVAQCERTANTAATGARRIRAQAVGAGDVVAWPTGVLLVAAGGNVGGDAAGAVGVVGGAASAAVAVAVRVAVVVRGTVGREEAGEPGADETAKRGGRRADDGQVRLDGGRAETERVGGVGARGPEEALVDKDETDNTDDGDASVKGLR